MTKKVLIGFFLFALPSFLFADTSKRDRKVIRSEISISDEAYKGPAIFLGVDVGAASSKSDQKTLESNKSGSFYGIKGVFSWVREQYTLDLGVGWQDTEFSGEEASTDDREKIGTSYGLADMAIRYRAGSWEFGPALQLFYGTDTSFSPSEVTTKSATTANFFGGINIYYGSYRWAKFDNRFGLQIMTDITIEGRQVSMAMLQWQWGIPLIREKPKTKVVEVVETVTTERTKIVEKTKIKEKQAYLIDAGFINFVTDSSTISNRDQSYLYNLGQYLIERQTYWNQVVITGHADKRGTQEYNKELALRRANAVINAMGLETLPSTRFQVVGHGFDDPVEEGDGGASLAKNRRVEIEIKGPLKTKRLKRPILKIRLRHRIPTTCKGKKCK